MTALNKQMKSDLLLSVVKDQFKDEVSEWEDKAKSILVEAQNAADKGFSKKIMNTLKGKDTSATVRTTDSLSVDIYGRYNRKKATNPFSKDGRSIYILSECFSVKETYVSAYGQITVEATEKIKAHWAAGANMVKRMDELTKDLYAVLNSVRTVKALKELTDVFTPFIKIEPKSKAMLPAESIVRINKLESPKGSK